MTSAFSYLRNDKENWVLPKLVWILYANLLRNMSQNTECITEKEEKMVVSLNELNLLTNFADRFN